MLLFFRKWLTSWPVLALLSLVLVAFVVTGVQDPFGGSGGVASGNVATVGKAGISETALLAQFDRTIKNARAENPTLTAQIAAQQGAMGQVLEQMIASAALEQYAAKLGIAISDRAVDGEIANIEAFRVNGKFDQATYKRVLADQRLSERDLRADIKGSMVRRQLLVPVAAGAQVPRGMAEPYAALLLETRAGQIALVPVAAVAAPAAPTDAQIEKFYQANKARYTLPERRAFRYALIDREAIAAGVSVSDAEIAKYFDANRDKFGGIETRRLAQVVVADEAKARSITTAVRAGSPFAAVAAAQGGFSATDIALGVQTKAKFAAATNAAVADAAFAAPVRGVTDPVKSDFGWHVVTVEAINLPNANGATAARDEIIATLRREKIENAIADTVAQIEDGFSGGSSFAELAKQFNLTVVSVPAMTADGRTMDNATYSFAPGAALLLGKAFNADPADTGSVVELVDGSERGQYAVLELGTIVPPTPAALAKIRPAVVAAWEAETRLATLKTKVDAVLAAVAKGTSLDAALAANKLPPAQPIGGRRIDVSQQA
ncbi:MAG: SurA N-terminal domain-containing protein, partial [Polymorphobacter sp.]